MADFLEAYTYLKDNDANLLSKLMSMMPHMSDPDERQLKLEIEQAAPEMEQLALDVVLAIPDQAAATP